MNLAADFSNLTWAWILPLALLAYPLTYFIFGLLAQPLVIDYYLQGLYELAAPTWGQLIPLQLASSALFLLICLPVIRRWQGSRRGLWFSLGMSSFILIAFIAVITVLLVPLADAAVADSNGP